MNDPHGIYKRLVNTVGGEPAGERERGGGPIGRRNKGGPVDVLAAAQKLVVWMVP